MEKSQQADVASRDVLSQTQAALYLGKSENTLARWRVNKKGPTFGRNGKSIEYRRADLDAWLEGQRSDRGAT